jgi:hypothetical protein
VAVELLLVEEAVDNKPQVVEKSGNLLVEVDINVERDMFLLQVDMHP